MLKFISFFSNNNTDLCYNHSLSVNLERRLLPTNSLFKHIPNSNPTGSHSLSFNPERTSLPTKSLLSTYQTRTLLEITFFHSIQSEVYFIQNYFFWTFKTTSIIWFYIKKYWNIPSSFSALCFGLKHCQNMTNNISLY